MKVELTSEQKVSKEAFRAFASTEIAPYATAFDQEECTPQTLIEKLAQAKYLGAIVPEDAGGLGSDMVTFGILHEEIGRACSSIRSLLTVHSMVSFAIMRWGRQAHKTFWLPRLATGETIGAFALTEPTVGSDVKSIRLDATLQGDSYLLNGRKKWITYAQIADLFLVFAQSEGSPIALLVEKESPGLSLKPMRGVLGTRASMLAEITFNDCVVPRDNLVGGRSFGLMGVASSALDIGRFSVASGCVGIGQACLDASLDYANTREQFGKPLKEHQLISQMLTNMVTHVNAARLLCYQAGYLRDIGSMNTMQATLIAKYFASRMATQAATDAVQIHGGNGCGPEYPVERYYRDAKVMEIIEGSTQMQQILIAENAYQYPL